MYPKPLPYKRRPALRCVRATALFALLMGGVAAAHAQGNKAAPALVPNGKLDSGPISQDPLSGIVINRTMTVLGWDFYKSFTDVWRAIHPDSHYTLTITERPTAKYGSEIWITYVGHQVFHTFLSPTRSKVNQVTRQAAESVYQTIVRYQQDHKLYGSKDLAPKEL